MFLNFIHNHRSNNKLLLERKTPHTRRAQSSKTINTEGLQEVENAARSHAARPTPSALGRRESPREDAASLAMKVSSVQEASSRPKPLPAQRRSALGFVPVPLSHIWRPSHSPCLALPWFYTERNGKGRTEEINTHVNAGGRYMFSNRRTSTGNNCSGFPTHVETLTIAIMILLGVMACVEPATQNRISIKAYLV